VGLLEPCWSILRRRSTVNHNLLLQKLYNKNVPHQLIKWVFSYLQQRSQRVRVGTYHSRWLQFNGGMPQGSRLGPLCFLALIDDLNVDCLVHKYVDDTTLTEIVQRSAHSNLQDCFEQLLCWLNIMAWRSIFRKPKRWSWGLLLWLLFFYQSRVLLVTLSKSALLNFWDFIWTPTFRGGPTSRLCYLKPPSISTFSCC